MGHPQFKITEVDDDTIELGVVRGNVSYDPESGQEHEITRISKKDLEAALKAAPKARKERESAIEAAYKNQDAFPPRIAPDDPRADSSPRSQDRPPIYVSSESNPSEANPQPAVDANADLERLPDGLADVPGNTNFEDSPAGPNVATAPDGVKAPKPKKNVPYKDTAAGKKAAADAKAAREGAGSTGSDALDAAAGRAVAKAAAAAPAASSEK